MNARGPVKSKVQREIPIIRMTSDVSLSRLVSSDYVFFKGGQEKQTQDNSSESSLVESNRREKRRRGAYSERTWNWRHLTHCALSSCHLPQPSDLPTDYSDAPQASQGARNSNESCQRRKLGYRWWKWGHFQVHSAYVLRTVRAPYNSLNQLQVKHSLLFVTF